MEGFTAKEIRAIANWCEDWLEDNQKVVLKEGFEDKYVIYDENGKTEVVNVSDIMSDIYAL